MFEAEITIGVLVCIWIMYELFGRNIVTMVSDWTYYLRIAGGIVVLIIIYWQASENPSGFKDTLDFAKQVMTNTGRPPAQGYTKEKRNVTNLMKKTVAADQKWKCGHCAEILDSSYEVDHKIALFNGGTNDMGNLIALCRNCHGKKTMAERLASKTS